ncbi:cyclophilin-like fold protein [Vulcaniibacterium tengchongense]|nr:cyclophilin-like fold protein [Vulcaniibacterium tengchongense]
MSLNTLRSTIRLLKQASLHALVLVPGMLMLGGCRASERQTSNVVTQDVPGASTTQERTRMWMTVGERRFSVTLADTDAAKAFAARLPVTLEMAELNGNEKHAGVSQPLPTDASRPGTIHNGDLMLYGASTVVVFYKTFRSSYAYTRLGRVEDPEDVSRVLGRGSSRVVFSEQ